MNLSTQSHAAPLFQFMALAVVFAAPVAEVAVMIAAIVCVAAWLALVPSAWMITRQYRRLRTRWGESYAGRAP